MNGIRFNSICTTSARFLSGITPSNADDLDGSLVVAALQQLEEKYRRPLAMFYLEELSYKEMAELLGLPIGTIHVKDVAGKANPPPPTASAVTDRRHLRQRRPKRPLA